MRRVDKLRVLFRDRKVGTLAMTPESDRCVFEYDKEWLADGFSISPLELPLIPEVFIAKQAPFNGNFGIFEDSLPDSYGRYLLHLILERHGINDSSFLPIQMLSVIGSSGMGALCYLPESFWGKKGSLPDFDTLQQMAFDVLKGNDTAAKGSEETLYFNSGNAGGCRPKCVVKENGEMWLVKMRQTYDPDDMGVMEYKYHHVAKQCDINVVDFNLFDGKYFGSQRFDIEHGKRLHVATAGGLMRQSSRYPDLDYSTLLQFTGFLTQDFAQVEEMYRRMVFNVFTGNKDDHAKNFAFICRDNGKWSLSPAYDLTRSAGYHGGHATTVNHRNKPTVDDLLAVAKSAKISKEKAQYYIQMIRANCEDLLISDYYDKPEGV